MLQASWEDPAAKATQGAPTAAPHLRSWRSSSGAEPRLPASLSLALCPMSLSSGSCSSSFALFVFLLSTGGFLGVRLSPAMTAPFSRLLLLTRGLPGWLYTLLERARAPAAGCNTSLLSRWFQATPAIPRYKRILVRLCTHTILFKCCKISLMPEFTQNKQRGSFYKGSNADGLHSTATLVAANSSASIDNFFHAWLLLVGHCVHSPSAAVLLYLSHKPSK